MPKTSGAIKQLRLQAGLSQNSLARKADLDRGTVKAAETGRSVSELTVSKIAQALSQGLGKEVGMDDLLAQDSNHKH